MTKAELVEAIATATKTSKVEAAKHLDATLETITKTLKKGDKISLTGFGTFEVRKRAARTARNPQTGESIKLKATKVPAFRAGKGLKDTIAGVKKP